MPWHPRQINNADGKGPTVPGEYLACPQATAPVRDFGEGSQFVCAFGNQLTSPTPIRPTTCRTAGMTTTPTGGARSRSTTPMGSDPPCRARP
jgi:hypothetical protein